MSPQSPPIMVETLPMDTSPKMTKRKGKPLAHFFVVLLLAIVTTLVHLLSARFMFVPSNSIAEEYNLPIPSIPRNNTLPKSRNESIMDAKSIVERIARDMSMNATERQQQERSINTSVSILLHKNVTNVIRNNRNKTNHKLFWKDLTNVQRKRIAKKLRFMSPIVAAGLPKTGTTSLHKYFQSLHKPSIFRSSHTYTTLPNGTKPRAGACMQENLAEGKHMLDGCGRFHVWSDSGYAKAGDCFYPLWHALDEFVQQYPRATLILNTRNATQWAASIQKWAKGSLAKRWKNCRNTPALPKKMKHKYWIRFYNEYHERIRQVCREHTSLRCIEFDISHENAGRILEANFGIPASHWRNCNPKDFTCIQTS